MNIFDPLSTLVAFVLEGIHSGLSLVLPAQSGWAWGLSVVLLTVTVRILLIPLFVKQIKSQRRMAELAPHMKALQTKHKGDRETLNAELMKLYKEHGTNPISGCLPMLLQMPIFFALFRVMNEFKPKGEDGHFDARFGLSKELIAQGANAEILGAPISATFSSSARVLEQLGASAFNVKAVAVIMILIMGATTFITQRQMMLRNGPLADPQQAQIQKFMLYALPLSFAVSGVIFPIGVLLYWMTTNVWSIGQQYYVLKRMPAPQPGGAPAKPDKAGKPKRAGTDEGAELAAAVAGPQAATPVATSAATAAPLAASGTAGTAGAARTSGTRPGGPKGSPGRPQARSAKNRAGSRKNKARKGGRR